ncbi:putative protein dltD [Clostridium botulinum A3 str. Loch Maree]|nr:putative protein dltD [Clostridium botulinum A3 str. Loch Maree]
MIPYYKFKHYLLFIKDKNMDENPKVKNFDWTEEKKKVTSEAKCLTTSNDFRILNNYHDVYMKEKVSGLKDAYKDISYIKLPEYDDFKYLLNTRKSIGLNHYLHQFLFMVSCMTIVDLAKKIEMNIIKKQIKWLHLTGLKF